MLIFRRSVAAAALATALLAVLAFVGFAPRAFAHDYLVSSNPAANSTQRGALSRVSLTFGEPALTKPSPPVVEVVGPDGKHYETGCTQSEGTLISVPVALGADGVYTVTWRVVSDDGHPVTGTFTFTHAGEGTTAATGSAATPSCKDGAAVPSTSAPVASESAPSSQTAAAPTASKSPNSAASSSTGGLPAVVIIVGAVIVVAAITAALIAQRRRR